MTATSAEICFKWTFLWTLSQQQTDNLQTPPPPPPHTHTHPHTHTPTPSQKIPNMYIFVLHLDQANTSNINKKVQNDIRWLYILVSGHYTDVIMGAITSQITSLTIVYSTVYSDADQRKHQSSASLTFVRGIHRRPVNSPHKWPVTRKMFPFDDVIMRSVCV